MTITQGRIRFWGSALGVLVFGLAVTSAMAQTSSRPSTAAARPLTDAERRTVEELEAARKQFDTAAARVMAASPYGRRRVAEAIARQFGVPEKSVNALRARRMGYGEVTVALALSHQLLKRDRGLTPQQAIDKVIALRTSVPWGVAARQLNLKLGDVIGEVKKADKQLAKVDAVTTARAQKHDELVRGTRPGTPAKLETKTPR